MAEKNSGCVARQTTKVDGVWVKGVCGKKRKDGSRYCPEHQDRLRAVKEQENSGADAIVEAAATIETVIEGELQPQKTQEVEVKARYAPTTIFDKVAGVLDNALEFEEDARKRYQDRVTDYDNGDFEALRYTDKAGAEQTRSEVMVYERAMDRTIRAVTAIARLNIDNQAMQMNNVLKGLVKATLIKVLQRLELSPEQINLARRYISEEFQKLSDRANDKTRK